MKRSRKMLMLLLALVLMLGGTLAVQHLTQKDSVSETETAMPLTALTADDVTGLSWTHDGVTYHFTKQDGAWKNADDAAFPASTDALNAMAEDLAALETTRTITGVKSIADYGIDAPVFTLTADWSDGSSITYAMGDALPFGDGYYLGLSDQPETVYAVTDALDDLFAKAGTELASFEALPAFENVTRITVGNSFDASLLEASATLDPDQRWYAADGTPVKHNGAEDLIADVGEIAWNELIHTSAGADTLAACDLDDASVIPVTLYDGENAVFALLIGGEADSTHRYARLPGSRMVYTIASSNVSSLLNATVASLAMTDLLPLEYAQVQEATLTAGSHSVSFSGVPAAEDAAESTEEAAEATDESTEADPYESLWQKAAALSGEAFTGEVGTDAETLLTIAVTSVNGVQETLVITSHDAESYLLTTADGTMQLVSAADVDALIRSLRVLSR